MPSAGRTTLNNQLCKHAALRLSNRLSSAEPPQSISKTHRPSSHVGESGWREDIQILAVQHPQAFCIHHNKQALTHRCSSTPGPRWTRSPARRRCSVETSQRTWWEREAHGAGCTPNAWSPAGGRRCGSHDSWPCRGCTARPRCALASLAGWCYSVGSRCPGSHWRWPAPCIPPSATWIKEIEAEEERREEKCISN